MRNQENKDLIAGVIEIFWLTGAGTLVRDEYYRVFSLIPKYRF